MGYHCLLLIKAAAAVKSLQLCPKTPETAAHQVPPHGILQARTLEWVAISQDMLI